MVLTDWLKSLRWSLRRRRDRQIIRRVRQRRRSQEFNTALEPLEKRQLMTIPAVVSIVRATPTTQETNATSLTFSVTFNEGVTASEFHVTETGAVQATTPVVVSGSGSTYSVTVNGVHGNGDVRLDLIDDDSIKDASNNALGGTGVGNGSFQGQDYLVDQAFP